MFAQSGGSVDGVDGTWGAVRTLTTLDARAHWVPSKCELLRSGVRTA